MCQMTRAMRSGGGQEQCGGPLHQHLAHQFFLETSRFSSRMLWLGSVTVSSAPAQVKPPMGG